MKTLQVGSLVLYTPPDPFLRSFLGMIVALRDDESFDLVWCDNLAHCKGVLSIGFQVLA